MELPILNKELRVTLRRRDSFFSTFSLYTLVSAAVTFAWAVMVENQTFIYWRTWAASFLFYLTLALVFFGFCFQAGMMASRVLVMEREKKTSAFVRVAPLSATNLIFQKMITPVLVEWLFFVGLLPVFSLVFLLGGVSPGEFAYQLFNLTVWLNTSISIGLYASAHSRSTSQAGGRTMAALVFFVFFIPGTSSFLENLMVDAVEFLFPRGEWKQVLQDLGNFLATLTSPLESLSPFWMAKSWFLEELGQEWAYHDRFFFEIRISQIFPNCPAGFSWLMHLALQGLLFRGAVRGWKSATEEATAPRKRRVEAEKGSSVRTNSPERPPRSPFAEGYWAFYDFEDRELFMRVRLLKIVLAGAYLLLVGLYYLVLVLVEERNLRSYGEPIVPVTTVLALLIGIGFASNSFRRERNRNCAVFLLTSPVEPRSIFFGKWMFHVTLVFKIMALAWICSLLWQILVRTSEPPDLMFPVWCVVFAAPWVPLLVGVSMFARDRPKTGRTPWRFLGTLGLFWGGGIFLLLLTSFVFTSTFIELGFSLLRWFFSFPFPWLLMASCVAYSLAGRNFYPNGSNGAKLYRWAFALVFGVALGLDLLANFFPPNREIVPNFQVDDARFLGRWLAIPAGLCFHLWMLVATRKREWWLRFLIERERS